MQRHPYLMLFNPDLAQFLLQRFHRLLDFFLGCQVVREAGRLHYIIELFENLVDVAPPPIEHFHAGF